jgi:peptidoglycan/xylan/chitin deacetylase (PgdA/CDA1 family)
MSSIRADRLATLYFIRPLRRIVSRENGARVPILMYHSISEPTGNVVHPYFEMSTSARIFESQMKCLREDGYVTISPAQAVTLLASKQLGERNYVVITFDDGFRDFYTHAFPILQKYDLKATMYLPTAYINQGSQPFLGRTCMNWDEVRELHNAGVMFGSHTVSHPLLRVLPEPELEREICESKGKIEDELGSSIDSFAYPYAFPEEDKAFTHRLRDLLKATGYHHGVSTVIGSVQAMEERYFLRRLPVNTWDDVELFRSKLRGDYNWLHSAQYVKKLIRRQIGNGSIAGTSAPESVS